MTYLFFGSLPLFLLVLSYKNHAIDEFLVDLVNAETRLSRDDLIRIGGQCKDARLQLFSERSAYQSDFEVKACRTRVDTLNRLRESIRFCLDNHVSSFMSLYKRMFFSDDESERRKASTSATVTVMESLVRLKKLRSIKERHGDDKLSPADVVSNFDFILVDSTGNASSPIQRAIQSQQGACHVLTLVAENTGENLEHWGDLVEKWLSGKHTNGCYG